MYGTAADDALITRADFERGMRYLNIANANLRTTVLQLAAQVVALTDEVTRRIDQVEPRPAPPGKPAPPPTTTVEDRVATEVPRTLAKIRLADEHTPGGRLHIAPRMDKYQAEVAAPPCAELLHLCHARCCKLHFALSTQDLDEGVIRWDYGRPYLIRQRASDGYCVHNEPTGHGCTVHPARPMVCRSYDCRRDERIWIDYDQRIAVPPTEPIPYDHARAHRVPDELDLWQRARARAEALDAEFAAVNSAYAEAGPRLGPAPDGDP